MTHMEFFKKRNINKIRIIRQDSRKFLTDGFNMMIYKHVVPNIDFKYVAYLDGNEEMIVELDKPMMGVHIPRTALKDMYDFSSDSALLVLASTHYDDREYIRDYDEYLKILKSENEND